MKPRLTCTSTEWWEEKSMEKGSNGSWSKVFYLICQTFWRRVIAWAYMAASGTGSLVFIDDVTADKSSRMNSGVYKALLSAQIQPNAAKRAGWCPTEKMTQNILQKQPKNFSRKRAEKNSSLAKSVTCCQPNWACFSQEKNSIKNNPYIYHYVDLYLTPEPLKMRHYV